jgi:hypothetical protein
MGALRAVKPGDKPVPRKSVAEAAADGNRRELLVAMRDRIARAVAADDCPPRDLASLTRRLQDIAKEIEALDVKAAEEAEDERVTADAEWEAI